MKKKKSKKEKKEEKKKGGDLTKGGIYKTLIYLSIPIILANLLETLYNVTDTFWVGRLGANAVAALSLCGPLLFLTFSLGMGLTVAGSILVSQFKGKKDDAKVNYIAAQTILIILIISIVLGALSFIFSDTLLKLIGATPELLPMASLYFKINAIGFVFVFGFMAIQSLLRGAGEVKIPMYIVLATVILNFLLDPLFIFGWKFIPAFGVGGAAVATIGTELLSTILGLIVLIKGNYGITIKLKDFKPNFKLLKRIFKLGFPTSIESSARATGFAVRTFLFATFGTLALASFGIAGRIFSFIIIPALSFSYATSTMVGQNLGAGKTERVKQTVKASMVISFIALGILSILSWIFAKHIITIFIPNSPDVIALGTTLLRFITITLAIEGIQLSVFGTLQGAGRTGIAMAISLISLWIIELPLAIILSKFTPLGIKGLFWSYPISAIILTIVTLVFLKKTDWTSKKLIDKVNKEDIKLEQEVRKECTIDFPEPAQ